MMKKDIKDKVKEYLLNEIEKANEDFKEICNDKICNDKRLYEISFLIKFDESRINKLLEKLDVTSDLDYLISEYSLQTITIIKYLMLNYNLKFNYRNNFSNNKSRFEKQIKEKKRSFDEQQEYASVQEYKNLPRRDLDLLYGFREYLLRHKFCDEDIIRILLEYLGYSKLPVKPTDWKKLNREWRENIVNDINEFHKQFKINKNNLVSTNEEIEKYSKDFDRIILRANQYKPKML